MLKAAVSGEDELISVITAVCHFPQVFFFSKLLFLFYSGSGLKK